MKESAAITIRPAVQRDVADLLILDNVASHGMSMQFWEHAALEGEGGNALVIARQRFSDPEAVFGWKNAIVAENETEILGAITAYEMPGPDEETEEFKRVFPGFVLVFELFEEAIRDWFIDSLGVFPGARNRSIANRLLDAALAEGRNRGYPVSSLVVEGDNLPAIRLYEKKGFVRTGSRPGTSESEKGEWWLMKTEL